MTERWRFSGLKLRIAVALVMLSVLHRNFNPCWSLSTEGLALLSFRERVVDDPFGALSNWHHCDGDMDPCSWFGVECSEGRVVVLNLKDLCLEGTLAPELGKLTYIKSIILRNNSFSGNIPEEIGQLTELEMLDLGYNNFSGQFPSDIGNNLSMTILLLDNNKFLGNISPELHKLTMFSEFQVGEDHLASAALKISCNRKSTCWNIMQHGYGSQRRLLQSADAPSQPKAELSRHSPEPPPSSFISSSPSPSPLFSPSPSPSLFFSPSPSPLPFSPSSSPSDSPLSSPSSSPLGSLRPSPLLPPMPASEAPTYPPIVVLRPPGSHPTSFHSPAPSPSPSTKRGSTSNHRVILIVSGVIGVFLFAFISVLGIFFCRRSKMVTVKPWATGLSGQLQKALVTGVSKLQLSELQAACEDFSNIIGSLPNCTVYKGTLSSGVEIAVISTAVKSAEDWPRNLETQFRKKIETLSRVNHKNFVNLIGYCEEEEPFARMMVFEYAPNGTLFEHLHIKEAEHLDLATRLRVAMGMAYCLEHMHQLNPPLAHRNLQSSSVYLTEDYAAKISDFSFWNEVTAAKVVSATMELLETPSTDMESNMYSFGVILFEMITGKIPYSVDSSPPVDWASDYLRAEQPLREMVDPILKSFPEEELSKLIQVIKDCVNPDPKHRPTMGEVTAKLKEITGMRPDEATPKLSPLWWAELEILSTEAN